MKKITMKLSSNELILFKKLLKQEISLLKSEFYKNENDKSLKIPDHDVIFDINSKLSCFNKIYRIIESV